jgi:hypothetical protein
VYLGQGGKPSGCKHFGQHKGDIRRARSKQKHTLTPQFGLIVFATRGMLLATQAVAIIIAVVRYLFELVQQSSVTNAMEPG